ncbi:hypothetical protein GCM10009087_48160 [Sphingomonas oligophenolica]|uniref:Peptidase M48 domain-containing protein n=1 Tax=Sphingomonas oligophenolica TaxID=301154 RepID=A0ABU9YCV7_9SPHN
MIPFEFLQEECRSVRAALKETLRHDYGPERSWSYFSECAERLDGIEADIDDEPDMDSATIATKLRQLSALGSRISLIERSHLGEFSWPFVETIRAIADQFLRDKDPDPDSNGTSPPIIHVVAEGMHYQIVDDVTPRMGNRRIVVVAFPRQLKHHVLLHSIFGHELGHTASASTETGARITHEVLEALVDQTALQDSVQATQWLRSDRAPPLPADQSGNKTFPEEALVNWRTEIICDLFGLMLFGPSFVAAHRTILEPLSGNPAEFTLLNSTHPPYAIRRQILAAAVRLLGWNKPITRKKDGAIREAENLLIEYISSEPEDGWTPLLSNAQLNTVLTKLKAIFADYPHLSYRRAKREVCIELVERLTLGRPPILQSIDTEGTPKNEPLPTYQCLYAGWCAWFGRDVLHASRAKKVPGLRQFTFLEINRLCDYAILQQCAIDLSLAA